MSIWSFLCYFFGLQDRHLGNIFIDLSNGNLIYIDYSDLFDPHLKRFIPDSLNFRLTKNFQKLLGPFKAWGTFRYYFLQIFFFFNRNQLLICEYLKLSMKSLLGETVFQEYFEQIIKKITNKDESEIEKLVNHLIEFNSNEMNYKGNYYGWHPDI